MERLRQRLEFGLAGHLQQTAPCAGRLELGGLQRRCRYPSRGRDIERERQLCLLRQVRRVLANTGLQRRLPAGELSR